MARLSSEVDLAGSPDGMVDDVQAMLGIGDVGRITPEGIFDFFFNIYLPSEHPINANFVPDDFHPLTRYVSRDIVHVEFDPGNYVSTSSVQNQGLGDQRK